MPKFPAPTKQLRRLFGPDKLVKRSRLKRKLLEQQLRKPKTFESLEPRQVAGSMLLSLPAPLSIWADSGEVPCYASNANSDRLEQPTAKTGRAGLTRASQQVSRPATDLSSSLGNHVASWIPAAAHRAEVESQGIQLRSDGTLLSGLFQTLDSALYTSTAQTESSGGLMSSAIGGLSSYGGNESTSGAVWTSIASTDFQSDSATGLSGGRNFSNFASQSNAGGTGPEGESQSDSGVASTLASEISKLASSTTENLNSVRLPSTEQTAHNSSVGSTSQSSVSSTTNNKAPNAIGPNVQATATTRGTRQILDFDNNFEDWNIQVVGGSDQGKGSVTHGSAILREGDSFLVGLSQEFIVPTRPSTLSFFYSELVFDTSDSDSINDTFEASLVDSSGRSLVHTIGSGREPFFNATEGESIDVARGVTARSGNVSVDISQLEPGSKATIAFRLINNDQDTGTFVRIASVELDGDNAPVATIELENDTAPVGPGSDPYKVDLLTNSTVVVGQASDDDRLTKLEMQVDGGAMVDITSTISNGRYRFDPGALPVGAHRIDLRATDTAGQSTVASLNFRVNAPPIANAGMDVTIPEGTTIQLDSSTSSDTEDPIFGRQWALTNGTVSKTKVISRTYLNNGVNSERLSVFDTSGSVAEDAIVVTVENVPPTFDSLPNQVISLKQPVVVHSMFSDPGVNDKHFATINWGDGVVEPAIVEESNGSGWFLSTHNYASTGLYNARLTLRDEDGGRIYRTFTVDVQATGLQITPAVALDDREFGYSERGTWANGTRTGGYKYDFRFALPGTGTRTASWSVRVPAGQYEVFTTWVADARHATNAPYKVFDSTTLLTQGAVQVDQQSAPSDFTYGGVGWRSLGFFNFAKGLPIIQVNDAADGRVVADGIMIASRTTVAPEIKIDLRLANDTAMKGVAADNRTSDPTIVGAIGGLNAITSLKAGFASPTVNILPKLVNGRITLRRSDLELIQGGPLDDGARTLFVQAGDSTGQMSKVFQLAFQLDTSVPLVAMGIPSETELPTIQVDVTSEPGAFVKLINTDEIKSAGSTGLVSFFNVPLVVGENEIQIEATDRAGNNAQRSIRVRRTLPDTDPPVLDVTLIADTGLALDRLTSDPRVQGTVLDASRITGFRAGIDTTDATRFADLLPDLRADGKFILTANKLTQIAGGTLSDGLHVLRLVATDAVGLQSSIFELQYTLDTQSPRATSNLKGSLLGTVSTMDISYSEAMSASAFALPSYVAEQVDATGNVVTTVPIARVETISSQNVRLHFATSLDSEKQYRVNIDQQVSDIAGNILTGPRSFGFTLKRPVQAAEVPSTPSDTIDLSQLSNVSSSLIGRYGQTSFRAKDHVLFADLSIHNGGNYFVDAPLLVAIKNLSDPSVHVIHSDGETLDGNPYYDFSSLVAGGMLSPQQTSTAKALEFYNPNESQFTYDLEILGVLNHAPAFTSDPDVEALVGKPYSYDVNAADLDGDTITYSLSSSPSGMNIDSGTGKITWTPGTADLGSQAILVEVDDGRGGHAQQPFTLSVIEPPPNRPPLFNSLPLVSAAVNAEYRYQAQAADADGDSLTFSLLSGPVGLTVDGVSGLVNWTPTGNQAGLQSVSLLVSDGRGGTATQDFPIVAGQQTGNTPPVIISQPIRKFDTPESTKTATGNVTPVHIDLDLPAGTSSTQTVSLTLPDMSSGQSFADILFVVDESTSMGGDQDWVEGMIPILDAALEARGIGPNRYSVVGFGGSTAFQPNREPGHPFNLIETATLTLFGPTASTALGSNALGPILTPNVFEATATTAGTQVVLVSDINDRLGGYRFRVLQPGTTTTPLTIGEITSGSIDVLREDDRYTFSLTQPTQLYFDALTNNVGLLWSLNGPAGVAVNNRQFTASDARFGQTPTLNLVAGDYTLTVTGASNDTGAYQFRLSDVASATPLTPGTPITTSLNPANESKLFRFSATAGERFYFDMIERPAIVGDVFWRLVDPYGNQLFKRQLFEATQPDVPDVTLAQSGAYTLALEGGIGDSSVGTYRFNVQPAPVTTLPITLGTQVTSAIAVAGEQDRWTFTLPNTELLYFDSLTAAANIQWKLAGPSGTLDARRFTVSDGASLAGSPVYRLPGGEYTLSVEGIDDAIGDYAFRLSALSSAQLLTPGTTISGVLNPATETDIYKFTVAAGDRFSFDLQTRTNGGSSVWRMVDPFGNLIFSKPFADTTIADVATLTLAEPGTYTLLLEGSVFDTTSGNYSFVVLPQGNTPPLPPAPSNALSLGSVVNASIGIVGEQDRYSFSLANDAVVYFDSLTNSGNFNWTLSGPAGTAVSSRSFSTSDIFTITNPVIKLVPGNYTLVVAATAGITGNYAFRLSDLATVAAATPGTVISGDLSPANETDLYRFSAQAGDRIYFDVTARSNPGSSFWRLVDPYGNILSAASFNSIAADSGVVLLSQTGSYTLILEGAITDTVSGSYGFNIQPAPGSTTALTLGSTVTSALATAGDQDRFTFSLASASQLYFDALTNNADLTWTLTGPGTAIDSRSFTSATLPIVTALAGQYTLTIDLPTDKVGNYSFRMLDLAAAVAISLGTPIPNTLSPANETDIYRFNALPSDRLYFDVISRSSGSQARWQLIDPFGNSVFNNFFTETGFSDVEAPTLSQPGVYTLLVEGAITDTGNGNYTLNISPFTTLSMPLLINSLTNGAISTPGEKDNYSFTLNSATLLNFDSLTNSNRFTWTLTGPTGTVVSSRTFDTSDGASITNPVVNVPAGDYVLTVDATGDSVGSYSFRLSDLSSSESFTPGTPVNNSLTPANATKLYQFNANAGDSFYFDVQSRSGANGARWRLIDPLGSPLFATSFSTSTDVDTLTLAAAGRYTLLIEGALADTIVGTFTFNVQPVSISTQSLSLGTKVSGSIGATGDLDRYTFKLDSSSLLYFDSLTNSGSITWTLAGPSGTVVQNRDFNLNNGEQNQPVLNLVAGDYTLTVDGKVDTVANYEFRLSALASATAILPGTQVTGSLTAANESDLYSFQAASGDRFYFDQQGRTGGAAFWRLIDPLGNIVFLSSFDNTANDVDTLTIAVPGTYTVLVEGAIVSTVAGTYSFNVQPVQLVTQPLVLGNAIAGAIGVTGEQDRFTFQLTDASLLYFDSLTNSGNINWTLAGPSGTAVLNRSFNFNGGETNQPLLNLVAGDYTLTIDGSIDTTGAYEFQLSDVASAAVIMPDQTVGGSIDPAKQTDLYRFSALANQRYSFDLQTRGGGLGNARWRLMDPYGTNVFNTPFVDTTSSDVATLTLAHSGNYTLLIEGGITDTVPGTYSFAAVSQGTATPTPPPPSTPLVLGKTVNDLLSAVGEQDRYSFSLATSSLLYFDALTNSGNLIWSLTGPTGTVVNNRNFQSSDSVNVGVNPVLNLPKGDYALTVFASGNVTGTYSFRLSSLTSATTVTPGTSVSDSFNVANETDLYRFNAAAGDRFYFDTQARTNPGNARQRLIDPFGNVLFFSPFNGSDVDVVTVNQTGTYTLLLEGGIGDTGIGNYTFNVQPSSGSTAALTLNSPVSGSIATPGDQDRYTFALSEATLLAFDARTNNASLVWNLVGPSGTLVSSRSFTNSDAANGNPVLNLTAGDYTLTIDAINDMVSTYDFRLNSLASALPITPGTPISGTLSPASETDLYRFNANAGDRVFFDTVTRTNAGNARQRLVDPYGNLLFTNVFSGGDVDVVTVTQSGTYTLLLEGAIDSTLAGNYTINVQPASLTTSPLDLNQPVNSALAVPGDLHNYTFSGNVGQRLFFDRLGPTTSLIVPALFAPSGNQVFSLSSNNANFGPFFLPETGIYRLSIDGIGDAAGAYGFELYDIATTPRPTAIGDIAGTLEFPLGSDLFQVDAAAGQKLVFMPRDDLYVGTAKQASVAMRALVANGNFEDGYEAINRGLNLDIYRPGSARNVVLVSDEDRDVLDPSLSFVSTFSALDSVDAKLNGVHDAQFRDANNRVVLGVDSHGTAYLADGAGGFTTAPGGKFVSTVRPAQTTKADYIDLAWALGGAAWDVNLLRGGGLNAVSFTKAFVEVKAKEIEEQLAIDVISSSAAAHIQNLTGPVTGIGANETATFNVQLSSDGTPQSFDLLFTRPGSNVILGSIPVTLNTDDYHYPVQAIDADGDAITFSLLTAPAGATIDATSGRITWSPPGTGIYRFVIQADDGRGGFDTQDYEVTVTSGAVNASPIITSPAPSQATAGLPFSYPIQANDPDGDLLSFFLTQAPTGMSIDNVSGKVTWSPTALQIGPQRVTIRVIDGRGGEATQTFSLNVVADTGNRAPRITSSPLTTIASGETYRYAAVATDPDNDTLTFDLVVAPDGMTVNSSGLIVWRPVAENVGTSNVILRVRDGRGGVHLQPFEVTVTAPGTAPCFSVDAPTIDAIVGRPYQYQFRAQDADGDSITFHMESGPIGLTIERETGVLAWTPAVDQLGPNSVVISAIDSNGLRTRIQFSIQVLASSATANTAPVITSMPRTSIGLGAIYLYEVVVSDANNDPLFITLPTAPVGMTLNADRVIQWQPTGNQLGNYQVVIQVADGRGGVTNQSFTIEVTAERANATPSITSTPPLAAVVGREYHYDLQGLDADKDPMFWSLTTAPSGMSIHPTLGTVCWHPDSEQLGPVDVVVRLDDGQGGFATQKFTIQVRAANLPPTIISTPLTQGSVVNTFDYQVLAQDPDGDALSFSLTTRPAGMTIDARSGLIHWTPTSSQLGNNNVVVSVSDGQGGITKQTFGILVTAVPANQPPRFTTRPPLFASTGLEYRYAAAAIDLEGDTLTFALASNPNGMTIDATTGLIKWVPTAAQIGSQTVRLTVTDSAGNIASQRFTVLVQPPNRSPQITSSPALSTTAGLEYNYDISASDPDDDSVTYSLTAAPAGVTIDPFGRISWSTTIADIGTHSITVQVTDPFGASATQTYQLAIAADTEPPRVLVEVSKSPAALGEEVTLLVSAADNVGVESLVLTIDGVPVAIDSDGVAVIRTSAVGTVSILVRATDAASNLGQDTKALQVIDFSDVNAPAVDITAPSVDAVIGNVVDIVGTVTDSNLQLYKLEVSPLGLETFTEIARGTTNVVGGVLGKLDPTMLQNDSYVLRLTATDTAGNTATTEQTVHIAGELKLGNFNLSFVDVTVPVFGVPITVGRTYDTLNASHAGDFGFGWRLEFRNMDLRTSVVRSEFEEIGIFNPFKTGSRVYLTLPGGERQGFTFRPTLAAGFRGGFLGIFEPRFVPDAGVKSSLTVTAADLRFKADGTVYDYTTGKAYNPADPAFGGSYLLTTKQGIAYSIDAQTGNLTALSDPTNNVVQFTDAGIFGTEGKTISFERDPQGRITSVVDPAGHRIGYQYDTRGDLISVTDRTNNTTQFGYLASPSHYLDKVIDPLGRTGVRTEYDAQGRLIKLLDAAGNPVRITYDPALQVNSITDALGNTTTEFYDQRGNSIRSIDAMGGITSRTFDADNNPTSITDPLGRTNTLTYNDRGDALTRTDPLGNTSIFSYQAFTYGTTNLAIGRGQAAAPFTRIKTDTDALGNTEVLSYAENTGEILAKVDALGNTVSFEYDVLGRPPSAIKDPNGHVTRFVTVNGLLTRQVDALGNATTFTYDAVGNQLTSTTTQTAANGTVRSVVTRTDYDAEGRVIAVTDAEGGVTRTEYDAQGNKTATIDALGRRTEYRYDIRNLLVETVFPDGTPNDPTDNPRSRTEYDRAARKTALIDELGRRTEYQYDAVGRLVKAIFPDGAFTNEEYDAAGQVIAQVDERGNRTEYNYDAAGRQVSIVDALGNVIASVYDAAGRRIAERDALGNTTHFVLDARGMQTETVYADGSHTSVAVDNRGQVIARTDQLNRITQYEYDAAGRLIAVVNALGQRTQYDYDESGNLIRQTDAAGNVSSYEFDRLSRSTATILPLGQRSETSYDAVGNVTAAKDANGATISFAYDARNRLTAKSLPNGASVVYAYTLDSQLSSVTDSRGVTSYTYDLRDRLLLRNDPDGAQVRYNYDGVGNRTSLTANVGATSLTTSYTFDRLNRLESVTDPDLGVTRYVYDAASNLIRTELPDGTFETRSYDALNRLSLLESRGPSGVINSQRYTRAANGRRDSVVDHDGRRVDYAYDILDRLTQEAITDAVFGDRDIDYTYDLVGNRLTRNDSVEGLTQYTYDANDRLLAERLAGDVTSYSYDNNGNMLSRINATDQAFYDWDSENRLISVDTDGDGTIDVRNEYDATGIRVSQTVNGEETRFLIDTVQPYTQVLAEYRSSGLITASYVRGERLISQSRNSDVTYYHADGLGSIRALTDVSGTVLNRYVYDAFGRVIHQSGSTLNSYLFVGEQRDAALGLDYLRARFLNSATGRFVSADSFPGVIRDPLSLNRYNYTAQNPVNLIDPSGHFFSLIDFAISNVIQNALKVAGTLHSYQTFVGTARAMYDFLTLGFFAIQVSFELFDGLESSFTIRQYELDGGPGSIKGIELKYTHEKGKDRILGLEMEIKETIKFNNKLDLDHPEKSVFEIGQELHIGIVDIKAILALDLVIETQVVPTSAVKLGIEGKFGPGGALKGKFSLFEFGGGD